MTESIPYGLSQEERVRKKLEEEFGMPLHKKRIQVVEGVEHEFDFVSEDGSIIGEVKTSGAGRSGLTHNRFQTIFGDISRDCLLLLAQRRAKKRMFVLTDETVYKRFQGSQYGKAAQALGIDIRLVQADSG